MDTPQPSTRTAGTTSPATAPAGSTAASAPGATTDATGARTDEHAETIAAARARIDALDARIVALVQERMAVSARIQEARIASGGRRVHLSREMEILARYRDALGKPGTTLAMTLLELCRGSV